MKKTFKIIFNILFSIITIFSIFILFLSITNKNDVPVIGKYSLLSVKGNSMYPVIKNGDLIVINRKHESSYEINDIISFMDSDRKITVTHQIVDIVNENGEFKYLTKGVNNNNIDGDYVLENEIIGKYEKVKIPFIGFVINFASTTIGYIILVVIPLGILLLIAIYKLIKEFDKKGEEL